MQKRVKILAILLIAQLLLAAGIGLTDRGISAGSAPVPLVQFEADKIDRITLEGADEAKVTLAKKDGLWGLPDEGNFPADSNRVGQLTEQIAALRSGTPVATSSGARERFKVSDEAFERRITLSQGDETVARLYLGTSPGMRLIHGRAEGSDDIYAIKMAAHDVPVKAADWEDKSILKLSKPEIASITVNGLTLKRTEEGTAGDKTVVNDQQQSAPLWQAAHLEPGKRLNAEAVDKLAGLLADLRYEKVLGRESKTEYGLENPVLEISLTLQGGDTLTYRMGKSNDKALYTLKVSNRPELFRLANYSAQPLIESASPDKLTETPPTASDGNAAATQPAEP